MNRILIVDSATIVLCKGESEGSSKSDLTDKS